MESGEISSWLDQITKYLGCHQRSLDFKPKAIKGYQNWSKWQADAVRCVCLIKITVAASML